HCWEKKSTSGHKVVANNKGCCFPTDNTSSTRKCIEATTRKRTSPSLSPKQKIPGISIKKPGSTVHPRICGASGTCTNSALRTLRKLFTASFVNCSTTECTHLLKICWNFCKKLVWRPLEHRFIWKR
ncbi:hypothetical protein ANCCAN_07719, partial [Ancylostoma caninum]